MVDLMCRLSNLPFFGIPLLYYVSFNSSIISCLSLGEIYLSFGISLLTSFDCISSLCDFFDALANQQFYYQLNLQLLLHFYELFFLPAIVAKSLPVFIAASVNFYRIYY